MSARSDGASRSAPPSAKHQTAADDRLLNVLRLAHDEVERKVATELQRSSAAQQTIRSELEQAQARNVELQKELEGQQAQRARAEPRAAPSRRSGTSRCAGGAPASAGGERASAPRRRSRARLRGGGAGRRSACA